MANEPSKTPTPQPQAIPLSKIHDLPGAAVSRQPDKNYGGLVTSIQTSGVKEPVVLRLREDGEYELVTGYRLSWLPVLRPWGGHAGTGP